MKKQRNSIAQDLRSPKYRKRVVRSKVKYDRKKDKHDGEVRPNTTDQRTDT